MTLKKKLHLVFVNFMSRKKSTEGCQSKFCRLSEQCSKTISSSQPSQCPKSRI